MTNTRVVAAVVAGLVLGAGTAAGQWVVEDLNPDGVLASRGGTVWEDGAAGTVFPNDIDVSHAAVWSRGAPSWVDLSPEGTFRTTLWGGYAGVFAGSLQPTIQEPEGACYWAGASADSVVRLHPDAAWRSGVEGVWGAEQVGWAVFTEGVRGCVWRGSAATLVQLSPPGLRSAALGVWDGEQAGWREIAVGQRHAGIWHGSDASWVDLAPVGARDSGAEAVYAGTQAGWVEPLGGVPEAAWWRGSVESWVNLAPAGSDASSAYAAGAGVQAGYASIAGTSHAGVWFGTADSWVDLHDVLPPRYDWSHADAVWSDGIVVRVMGTAGRQGWPHAVLWTGPAPAGSASDFNADGFIDFFDYDAFLACFEGSGCPAGKPADFNGDGFVDFADYADFVTAFEAGA